MDYSYVCIITVIAIVILFFGALWFCIYTEKEQTNINKYKRFEDEREKKFEDERCENNNLLMPIINWCFANINAGRFISNGIILFTKNINDKETKIFITNSDKLCIGSSSFKIKKGTYEEIKKLYKLEKEIKINEKDKLLLDEILESCK